MSQNKAIVTGASSGIGLAICERLCKQGYEVYGFGRDFNREEFLNAHLDHALFHTVVCDVLDTAELTMQIKRINEAQDVTMLINNAGCAYYGLHEELNTAKIQKMVRTNLEVPMILTQLLLRTLKKNAGTIINISSVTATKSSPHGCAYGATKAGLSSFGKSLFDEARKYGVKVITIQPDITKTQLYRNADFTESDNEDERLLPEEVADAVSYILNLRPGMLITEVTIQPQKHGIRKK